MENLYEVPVPANSLRFHHVGIAVNDIEKTKRFELSLVRTWSRHVEGKVKEIMANVLGVDQAIVSDEFSSDTVEQWDSIRHISLVLALEEEFQVEFDETQIGRITTFRLIVDALKHNGQSNEGNT